MHRAAKTIAILPGGSACRLVCVFHSIFCLINHRFKNDNQRVVSFYAHVGGSDDFDAVLHVSFRPHRTSNLLRKTATKMHPHLPLQHEVIFFLYWIVWEKF